MSTGAPARPTLAGCRSKAGRRLSARATRWWLAAIRWRAAQPLPNIPTLSHNAATTVVLSTGNTVDGFIVTNSAGSGIAGVNIGTTAIADIAVTVTGGTALAALTSGTLTVTGSANTLNSTNNAALNVNAVTIGAGGLTFQSINSGAGASVGISLVNTGSTGGLNVTGNGTSGVESESTAGGTIANKSGNAIVLNNTAGVRLNDMVIGATAATAGTASRIRPTTSAVRRSCPRASCR
jgi:hypothetical protein